MIVSSCGTVHSSWSSGSKEFLRQSLNVNALKDVLLKNSMEDPPGRTTSPRPSILPRPGPGNTSLIGASRLVATVTIMGLKTRSVFSSVCNQALGTQNSTVRLH